MFRFAKQPTARDFEALAERLADAQESALHPALWPTRVQVAQRLRQMAQQPEREANQSVYQALRLFVW